MPRLFLGNFDFEHRLADPTRQLPAKLERINAELASSWLAIADEGDYLWTPQPIEASFFEQAVRDGLPRVIPVVSFDEVPRGVECIPWGWTDDIRQLCDRHSWLRNDAPNEAVRAGNSRRFSAALEREWLVGLNFAGEATSLGEIERFISFHGSSARWVVKAEFGMSARERILGCGPPTEADRNWIAKRLTSDGVVFFEPWVERIDEVGIQIDIPHDGDPQLIGVTPMLVDERGQYAGSWFATRMDQTLTTSMMFWKSTIDVALRAAKRHQELGYFGPLGIDAMRYRAANGAIRLRPLQDMNARWTMGRLSLGWRRLLQPDEVGCWHHGPRGVLEHEILTASLPPIDKFREFLVTKERRLAPEREAVVKAVFESQLRFDADVWVAKLEQRKDGLRVSRSTVYRTLNLLEEAGLIKKVARTDDREVYEQDHFSAIGRIIRTSPEAVGGHPTHHKSWLKFIEPVSDQTKIT